MSLVFTLAQLHQHLPERLHAELLGDKDYVITGLATLEQAQSQDISFLSNPKYASQVASSQAGAMIISPQQAHLFMGHKLVMANPYLGYALLSSLFADTPDVTADTVIHASAQVANSAVLGQGVRIEPGCSYRRTLSIRSGNGYRGQYGCGRLLCAG